MNTDLKQAQDELFAARANYSRLVVAMEHAKQWIATAKRNHDDLLHGRDADWLMAEMFGEEV